MKRLIRCFGLHMTPRRLIAATGVVLICLGLWTPIASAQTTATLGDGDYTIEFLGTTDNGDGTFTWAYQVTEATPDVDNPFVGDMLSFILELDVFTQLVDSFDPLGRTPGIRRAILGIDGGPTGTQFNGLRWDMQGDFDVDGTRAGDSRVFSFVLAAEYATAPTGVAVRGRLNPNENLIATIDGPTEEIDPPTSTFAFSMSVVGQLNFDNGGALEDQVIASVDGEVRGISQVMEFSGALFHLITVQANEDGETIELSYFDADLNETTPLTETFIFAGESLLGDFFNPQLWTLNLIENDPDWVFVPPPTFTNQIRMFGSLVLDGVPVTSNEFEVAAFVGDELRGVGQGTLATGELIYDLRVFSDQDGETVSFRAYDVNNDAVRFLSQTVTFSSGDIIGNISNPFVWTEGGGPSKPTWLTDLDPFLYGSSMSVVGHLYLDAKLSGHPDNMVAAFFGSELRGVVIPTKINGSQTYFLTIYGDTNGEVLSFQAYYAMEDSVVTLPEEIPFTSQVVRGNVLQPFSWGLTLGVEILVFLEGAFDGETRLMHTRLQEQQLIPATQPYGNHIYIDTPLYYTGTEYAAVMPEDVVDWVLVELRSSTFSESIVARRAALLRYDGRLIDVNGSETVYFKEGVPEGEYYVVIRHRNHVPVMTKQALEISTRSGVFNFVSEGSFGKFGQRVIEEDMHGLFGADGDATGGVTSADQQLLDTFNAMTGYLQADYDLNGTVSSTDGEMLAGNLGVTGEVPGENPEATSSEDEEALPEAFSLSQNYPNPFNPVTTIEYALPEMSEVELMIFDVLGRQLVTLVSDQQMAGRHEVSFDASGLPSGIYFYRIHAGKFTTVRSMMLLK